MNLEQFKETVGGLPLIEKWFFDIASIPRNTRSFNNKREDVNSLYYQIEVDKVASYKYTEDIVEENFTLHYESWTEEYFGRIER